MKPRVHRHLAGQVMELATELKNLPDHPILTADYEQARLMMRDAISLAMKYEMRADVYTGRSDDAIRWDVKLCRNAAAEAWWGFRLAVRKARMYHGFARVLLAFDQGHIT